jgi:hypothetical protein
MYRRILSDPYGCIVICMQHGFREVMLWSKKNWPKCDRLTTLYGHVHLDGREGKACTTHIIVD